MNLTTADANLRSSDSGNFMGNYDRGIYEPSDDMRVFDSAEEDDDVEGSRLPLLIVLALLVLAMFAGVVWLAYTQGVARGRGETPVLAAAAGPERVAPPGGGAGTVPYQGFKIYEQPAPPDDEATDSASAPQEAAKTAPKPAPMSEAAAKPAPAAQAPVAAAPKPAPVAPPPPKPSALAAEPPKPAPAPAAKAPAQPKSVATLIQQANSPPEPVKLAAKPVTPPPAAKPAPAPLSTVATGAPRQLGAAAAPPPTKLAVATPAPAPAVKPVTGGYALQIGAYKSQAEAETAWKDYKTRHAALLAGYSDEIQQADLGPKGTWYRLRVGGLADREVAVALCERLKADGGACILGR